MRFVTVMRLLGRIYQLFWPMDGTRGPRYRERFGTPGVLQFRDVAVLRRDSDPLCRHDVDDTRGCIFVGGQCAVGVAPTRFRFGKVSVRWCTCHFFVGARAQCFRTVARGAWRVGGPRRPTDKCDNESGERTQTGTEGFEQ